MITRYNDVLDDNGISCTLFFVKTKKGEAHGIFYPEQTTIYVHGIIAEDGMKGLMNIIIARFKTHHIIFTPLVNDNIKNKVRGTLKIVKANDAGNPYGEDIETLDCQWKN